MSDTKSRRWLHIAVAECLVGFGLCAVTARAVAAQTPTVDAPGAASTPANGDSGPDQPGADKKAEPGSLGFFQSVELGAAVDLYYDYYSTKPVGDALYRNFDAKHDQLGFSMAQLWLSKVPTTNQRAGFTLKMNFGPAATMINAFEPSKLQILENIEQSYVSYLAPMGKGLQIDVGKFVTQHGAEVIESKDNWNYSRSLLFALAIPYYHMGVRATYTLNDKVAVMGNVVNGWNNVVENNGAKSFGAQITVKPVPQLSIVQNYMAGPEQADDAHDWRQLSDTIVTYTATPKLSLMANYDYGRDSVAGLRVAWQGLAGYAKYQVNKWWAISPRVEWFDDSQGFMTGTGQALKEGTLTFELKPAGNLLWRIEYRRELSDATVFQNKAGEVLNNRNSVAFGVLYAFTSKPQ
jgi:Putative beta-barrel porin-2, OmpL-like. bbp2